MGIPNTAFVAAIAGAVAAIITAFIGVVASYLLELPRLRISSQNADAAVRSADAAQRNAVSSEIRGHEELQRSAVAALCKMEAENLERLRAALAELAAIANGAGASGVTTTRLDEPQRQRGVLLAFQLKMSILPNMPLAEALHLDIGKVRELLSQSTTISNPSLWMRYFDNALLLLDEEERRIKRQLVEGRYIERKSLKPQTTLKDSFEVHGHY